MSRSLMLWLRWFFATAMGLAWAGWLGHFPFGFPPGGGPGTLGPTAVQAIMGPASLGSAAFGAVIGAAGGAGVALVQWVVLRQTQAISAWWIPATMTGIAAMHAVGDPIADSGQVPLFSPIFGLVAVIGGAVIGGLQFLQLRGRFFGAGWWILASAVSWGLGVIASLAVLGQIGVDRWSWQEGHAFVGLVAGAVVGAITGAILANLQPFRASQPRTGSARGR